jgi:endonuclease-3
MKKSDKKRIGALATEIFEKEYTGAVCSLDYKEGDAFQLLIATRLSAQCTDARVNLVTPALFSAFPDAYSMAAATVEEVENYIKSCGLYKTKAKDLVGIAKMLCEQYGGVVPDTVDELIKLPGVGRKTANLVCGDIYGKPAIVTDTHFIRLCNRFGFERKGMHAIRRYYATKLINAGVEKIIITAQMGHADFETTTKHYYKNNSEKDYVVERISKAISG